MKRDFPDWAHVVLPATDDQLPEWLTAAPPLPAPLRLAAGRTIRFSTEPDLPRARFRRGTRIATARGEVPVERLQPGDVLLGADGDRLLLRATRRYAADGRADRAADQPPWHIWPVRVQAGAFGADRPHRDLWLGPDHAVLADGVLIPLRHLADGYAVAQRAMASIEYWACSLERSGVLLAEGLAVETGPAAEHDAAAALIRDGLLVEAVRARIARRRAD